MTAQSEPLLSVVVTSRNDDHGGTLLRRMQTFTNHFIGQCRRHGLPAELIIVEWNPPVDRPHLTEALRWPADFGPCQVRVIEVPPEIHQRHRHAAALPLFQMIGKNVGIRRARGKYVVATNIDILFSDEMVRFILADKLRSDRMYRVDRMDVMTHVPVDASVEEQLAYCRSHYLRRNAREGTCRLNSDGSYFADPEDVIVPGCDIVPLEGIFPLERTHSEPIRWIGPEASFRVTAPAISSSVLALEVEPGPAVGYQPIQLQFTDATGGLVARAHVEGRQSVLVRLPLEPGQTATYFLHIPQETARRGLDPRPLAVGLFRCSWEKELLIGEPGHPDDLNCAVTEVGQLFARNVAQASDGIRFTKGIYSAEPGQSEGFHWVGPEATLLVTPPSVGPPYLCLEVKEGPSLAQQRLVLEIYDDQTHRLAQAVVEGRARLYFRLPCLSGQYHRLKLRVRGNLVSLRDDPRQLCYRLYRCSWSHGPERPAMPGEGALQAIEEVGELEADDVVSLDSGIRFGRGWYCRENYNGEVFRWGRTGAILQVVTPPEHPNSDVSLLLDPARANGDTGPFQFQLRDSHGQVLGQISLREKQMVRFPLPRGGRTHTVSLHVDRSPIQGPNDPRPLSFRLLAQPVVAELSAPTDRVGRGLLQRLWDRWQQWATRGLGPVSLVSPDQDHGPRKARDAATFVAEDGLPASGSGPDPKAAPEFLHCNACGDFTLLAREQWHALRAYPEPQIFSLHIDSLFCYQAHCAGMREEMLPRECEVYHIEHSEGSGWTPEGAAKLLERVTAKGIPVLDCADVFRWAAQMQQEGAMSFNQENWGLADATVPETILPRDVRKAA